MLMIFLPVPAEFVYLAPTPLLPLSVQYFSASLSKNYAARQNISTFTMV